MIKLHVIKTAMCICFRHCSFSSERFFYLLRDLFQPSAVNGKYIFIVKFSTLANSCKILRLDCQSDSPERLILAVKIEENVS